MFLFTPIYIAIAAKLRQNWRKEAEPLPLPTRLAAFTLIELSIVLVIIGLIVGGVLVGLDLKEMAEARAQMSQMEKFQLATTTFKLKYNCIPGDCKNAATFGLGTSGNGDRYIGALTGGECLINGSTCFTTIPYSGSLAASFIDRGYGELQRFWTHLSNAGFLGQIYSTLATASVDITNDLNLYFPKDAKAKGYIAAASWNGKLYLRTGMSHTTSSTSPRFASSALNSAQMSFVSSKVGYKEIIIGTTTGYPNAIIQGQRTIPLGIDNGLNTMFFYRSPLIAAPSSSFTPCVISDGSGGYKYNIEGDGDCNMLWEIDY